MDHYPDYLNKCVWSRGERLTMRVAWDEDAGRLIEFCRQMSEDANAFRLSLPTGEGAAGVAAELEERDEFRSVIIIVENVSAAIKVVALGAYRVEAPNGLRCAEMGMLVPEAWRG